MALGKEFQDHLRDHFSGLGDVRIRRMFGGAGLYLGDACFAIVLDEDRVMMRGDDTLGPDFEAAGATRWVYQRAEKAPVAMPYWSLPEDAIDDPDLAVAWARRALVPAEAAAAEKRAAKARKAARQAARSRDV